MGAVPVAPFGADRRRRRDAVVGAALVAVTIERVAAGGAMTVGLGALAATRPSWRPSMPGVVAAVASAATLSVLPRVDDTPARGVAVASRKRIDPSDDGAGLCVVVNAASGSGRAPAAVEEIAAALPHATIELVEDGDLLAQTLTAAAARARSLGVVGGDGTVSLAARAALDHGVPLAVFPGGTLNHFARDLGLDSIAGTVDAIRSGHVVAIDVGEIADRVFLNNASLGSYSEVVDARERLEGRLGKWPAMLVATSAVLRRGQRHEVVIDGERRRVWMVFVGNGAFEPAGFAPSDRPDLADGLLDVRIVDATHPWSRVRLVGALFFGALARSRVYDQRCATTLTIATADDLPTRLAADGETFDGPAEVSIGKKRVSLLVHVPER